MPDAIAHSGAVGWLRADFPNHARALRQIASDPGDTGRSLMDEIDKRKDERG